jgi:hypothetical protein
MSGGWYRGGFGTSGDAEVCAGVAGGALERE